MPRFGGGRSTRSTYRSRRTGSTYRRYNNDGSRTYIRYPRLSQKDRALMVLNRTYRTTAPRELKYLDCAFTGIQIKSSIDASGGLISPTSGCTGCFSVPAIGYGNQERLGQEFYIHSFNVSGTFTSGAYAGSTNPNPNPWIFIALVLDKQTNFIGAASNQVYDNINGSVQDAAPYPNRNMEYIKRYQVLKTKFIQVPWDITFNDSATTGMHRTAINPTFKFKRQGS